MQNFNNQNIKLKGKKEQGHNKHMIMLKFKKKKFLKNKFMMEKLI